MSELVAGGDPRTNVTRRIFPTAARTNQMGAPTVIARLAVLAALVGLAGCTSSASLYTRQSAYQCVLHAKQVLYDSDFTENLVIVSDSGIVSGRHGGYDASVFCGAGDHLIRVDVHGLDQDQIDWYRKVIIRKF